MTSRTRRLEAVNTRGEYDDVSDDVINTSSFPAFFAGFYDTYNPAVNRNDPAQFVVYGRLTVRSGDKSG
jgi:hypothetical protein